MDTDRDGSGARRGPPTSDDDDQLGLGHLLEVARKRRGWNQYRAADHFGVNQSTYQRWESRTNPTKPKRHQVPAVADFVERTEGEVLRLIYIPSEDPMKALTEMAERIDETAAEVARQKSRLEGMASLLTQLVDGLAGREYPSDMLGCQPVQDG